MVLYLQEALGVLQQVQATVAAVVLERNPTVGAPHAVEREQTRRPPPDLPLHLQVAEDHNLTQLRNLVGKQRKLIERPCDK